MSSFNEVSLQGFRASYQRLAEVASKLNNVSDEMGGSISRLDEALKILNLGIEAWYTYDTSDDEYFWSESKIGYAKIGSKWGIALNKASGFHHEPEETDSSKWLFNDAPRGLRLDAISHIPKLIDALIAQTESTIENVRAKSNSILALAEVINPHGTNPVKLTTTKFKAGKANG